MKKYFFIGIIIASFHAIAVYFTVTFCVSGKDSAWYHIWSLYFVIDFPFSLLGIYMMMIYSYMYEYFFLIRSLDSFLKTILIYPISNFQFFTLPFCFFGVLGTVWHLFIPILIANHFQPINKKLHGIWKKILFCTFVALLFGLIFMVLFSDMWIQKNIDDLRNLDAKVRIRAIHILKFNKPPIQKVLPNLIQTLNSEKHNVIVSVSIIRALLNVDLETKTLKEIVRETLKDNINLKDIYIDGWTSLMEASCYTDSEVVKFLIEIGADVNVKASDDSTALIAAIRHDNWRMVKFLINAKINYNEPALIIYDRREIDKIKIVELLLKSGSDINAKNKDGETALMIAASKKEQRGIVELLLKYGSDINAKNKDGETALMIALQKGHTEVVELLTKTLKEKK